MEFDVTPDVKYVNVNALYRDIFLVGTLMNRLNELLEKNRDCPIAIYGLGTETERFLAEHSGNLSVIGLLDGFREDGEMYGYPIISIGDAIGRGVTLIIVVARPGSCKAIAKRIGDICRENNIRLFDVRGNDLLISRKVSYDFRFIDGFRRSDLVEKIEAAKVVSFDLFDTLVTRKVLNYTDVFELLDAGLAETGPVIPDFAKLRLSAEKECSKDHAPRLTEIYEDVIKRAEVSFIIADELAEMEWEIDRSLVIPRKAVCEIYKDCIRKGKRVFITTDSYYSQDRIGRLLSDLGLDGYEQLIVSCDKGTSKTQELFEYVKEYAGSDHAGILHIGDDEAADIEPAEKCGINTFRLYSGYDLFDMLGGLGFEKDLGSLSDRVKAGLIVSRIFSDPFVFEGDERRLSVKTAYDIGYLFCAPMITDFVIWLKERMAGDDISQMLFCARDGFLVKDLYEKIDMNSRSYYFLTSRTAAIRAGVRDESDISYVDSMKYFGTDEDSLRVRFGISGAGSLDENGRVEAILKRSAYLRNNYKKYIDKMRILDEESGMFDFVAKGTTQLYLQRLLPGHLKGFYFLQLEPEFMADKGLDIEPFYSDKERDSSAIFDNYYILETMLTSPDPAVEEFDPEGNPVYADETRSDQDIRCFMSTQDGIRDFFDDFVSLVPEGLRTRNKPLDEELLALINNVKIEDEAFMSLTVEDPFFGRMTDIKDVVG